MNEGTIILIIAILAMMVLAMILAALPKECVCEHCAFHRNARHLAREADRIERHRYLHAAYRLPWPYGQCDECKAGHSDDQPTERNP